MIFIFVSLNNYSVSIHTKEYYPYLDSTQDFPAHVLTEYLDTKMTADWRTISWDFVNPKESINIELPKRGIRFNYTLRDK